MKQLEGAERGKVVERIKYLRKFRGELDAMLSRFGQYEGIANAPPAASGGGGGGGGAKPKAAKPTKPQFDDDAGDAGDAGDADDAAAGGGSSDLRRPQRSMSAPESSEPLSPEQELRRRTTEAMREARERKFSNRGSRNDSE